MRSSWKRDPTAASRAFELFTRCFDQGVLTRATGNVLALSPPPSSKRLTSIEPVRADQSTVIRTLVKRERAAEPSLRFTQVPLAQGNVVAIEKITRPSLLNASFLSHEVRFVVDPLQQHG